MSSGPHMAGCVSLVDSHKLRQQLPVLAVLLLKGVEQAVDTGRDKQVLLLQAQQTAVLAGVVGVEDGADGLGFGALGVGQGVVAAVECLKVKVLLDRLCGPDAQLVDGLAGIAHNGDVIWDGQDVLRVHRAVERAAVLLKALDAATELDGHGLVLTTDLPGIAVGEPLVGGLDLAAVDNLLLKQAVTVAHAVAVAGNASAAMESRKHAARRPRPPLPRAGSGSWFSMTDRSKPMSSSASATMSRTPKLSR